MRLAKCQRVKLLKWLAISDHNPNIGGSEYGLKTWMPGHKAARETGVQFTARAWTISRAATGRTSDASRVTTATVSPESVVNSTS
jgi:hypothetical protein